MTLLKIGTAACCAILLTSCHALRDEADPNTVSVRGVPPTLEQLNVPNTRTAQNLLVNDLIEKSGLKHTPGPRDGDWSLVAEAGIYEIGRQCDQYLDVLFHFNRNQRAIRQGMTAVGAATATILGLAGVAAAPIAITAAAFGLSASLFDAGVNSVLFSIEPSALRNIVLQGRKKYIDSLDTSKISSRPLMMIALQGYLTQCTPSTIEGNVNAAASGAESVASTVPGVSARSAALAAPAATLIQRATVAVAAPVAAPPPLQGDDRPRNLRPPAEAAVSKRTLIAAQEALGVTADGNFGPSDASDTRIALQQFQLGRNRRDPVQWPAGDVTGLLSSRTGELVPFLSPMPPVFRSPFERAVLGNNEGALKQRLMQPDPSQLEAILGLVKVPDAQVPAGNSPEAVAAKMKLLRERLAAIRTDRQIDPSKGGVLDAKLYDSLIANPP